MIARLQVGHAFAHAFHYARAFMPTDDRQREVGQSLNHVPIAVADAGRRYLDQDFARLRRRQINRFDAEGRIDFVEDCRLHLHGMRLSVSRAT